MTNNGTSNRSIHVVNSQVGVNSSGDNAQINLDGLHFNHLAGDMPADKERLTQLVTELNQLLKQVPEEKKADAEAVATLTQDLIQKADAPAPNKTLIRITADGMKEAAKALAGVVPTAIKIVTDITEMVSGMLK